MENYFDLGSLQIGTIEHASIWLILLFGVGGIMNLAWYKFHGNKVKGWVGTRIFMGIYVGYYLSFLEGEVSSCTTIWSPFLRLSFDYVVARDYLGNKTI